MEDIATQRMESAVVLLVLRDNGAKNRAMQVGGVLIAAPNVCA